MTGRPRKARPKRLFANKGYDAEWVHRQLAGAARGAGLHPLGGPPVGRDGGVEYLSRMTALPKAYGKRWHVECLISELKRSTGAALAWVKANTLDAEAALQLLAHSIRR